MGLFYTNVILHKVQQQPLAEFISKQGRVAYVSPTRGDFTAVYDKETENQDAEVLKKLTKVLTRKFVCSALASLVHDSDLYMYWLYQNGKLLDSYHSLPGYFDPDADVFLPGGGDIKKLCMAFGNRSAESEIQKIFNLVEEGNMNSASDEYLQGEDILSAVIEALETPPVGAFTGYYTIENNHLPNGLNQDSLIKTQDSKAKWFWDR